MLNRFFKGLFANKTSNTSKKFAPRRTRLGLEPLEARWVPAGTVAVSFAAGVLTVTGDADANDINIVENAGTTNSYTVATGTNATTITGTATNTGVTSIV